MSDFSHKYHAINIDQVKDYLENLKYPCYESELIKIAFAIDQLSALDSLALYQYHFLLFHLLFRLKDEYRQKNRYLHIHFMRTFLLDFPQPGYCRYYYEQEGRFCRQLVEGKPAGLQENYCLFHQTLLGEKNIEILSLQYFYLNEENYYKLNRETAEQFINGVWQIFNHHEEMKKCFAVLDLPETDNIDLIKSRYKKLAKKYHPDLFSQNLNEKNVQNLNQKFNEINNAYQTLIRILNFSRQ